MIISYSHRSIHKKYHPTHADTVQLHVHQVRGYVICHKALQGYSVRYNCQKSIYLSELHGLYSMYGR